MIQSKSKGMTEAMEAVRTMGLVKNLRWMFEQRQKAMRDRWAEDDFIREESEAKGVLTGTRNAIIKVLGTFGEVPEHLRIRVMSEQNTEILDRMLQEAAAIREIQEFADKWC
ncbi:MAG: hypothetical protein J6M66_13310 [Lachnospiraceae bacterium]|nr:hypothetical protein [Lachnospiraceae bacterium]